MRDTLNHKKIINDILIKSGIQNVYFIEIELTDSVSCAIRGNDSFYIGIDLSKLKSTAELRSVVYHELGHIATNTFYSYDTPKAEKDRRERIAVQWAITNCVPFDDLRAALSHGVSDVYGLAEYFDITIDSAWKVLDYYKDKVIEFLQMFYGDDYNEKEA